MPLYEYKCKQCKKHTEKIQKFSHAEITECPHCKGPLERVVSAAAISFKGGGWFKDGYSHAKPKSSSKSESKTKSDSGASASSTEAAASSSKDAAPAPASSAPGTTSAPAPAAPAGTESRNLPMKLTAPYERRYHTNHGRALGRFLAGEEHKSIRGFVVQCCFGRSARDLNNPG